MGAAAEGARADGELLHRLTPRLSPHCLIAGTRRVRSAQAEGGGPASHTGAAQGDIKDSPARAAMLADPLNDRQVRERGGWGRREEGRTDEGNKYIERWGNERRKGLERRDKRQGRRGKHSVSQTRDGGDALEARAAPPTGRRRSGGRAREQLPASELQTEFYFGNVPGRGKLGSGKRGGRAASPHISAAPPHPPPEGRC